jgi:8-oxo-dGTP pyrophosphatase MutT (NUDIX family)
MYKVYINDRPFRMISVPELSQIDRADPAHLVARYNGKAKTLLNYIDTLEKGSPNVQAITLYSNDMEQLWSDFRGHYQLIRAAGGLVHNERGEILFIYRLDNWDLPKGKMEDGETKEAAALREVAEETGVRDLELKKRLKITYHTYRSKKGNRILKQTFWYAMQAPAQALVPQTEESIEQAVWMSSETFFAQERVVYNSILDVLRAEDL